MKGLLVLTGLLMAALCQGNELAWTAVKVEGDAELLSPLNITWPGSNRPSPRNNGSVAIENLIAYGDTAKSGQFPFLAALLKKSKNKEGVFHSCTATLIAPTLLLTAAHCFFNADSGVWEPPNFAALGGIDLATTDNFAEVISVKEVLYPSTYSWRSFDSSGGDIGLVVLRIPSGARPVSLATTTPPTDGALLTAVGWGVDETAGTVASLYSGTAPSKMLRYTSLRTSAAACADQGLPAGVFCAQGTVHSTGDFTSTCSGDSGGPELLKGRQVAVTSYGPSVACGRATWGAYTSVSYYYTSFIKPAMSRYGAVAATMDAGPSGPPSQTASMWDLQKASVSSSGTKKTSSSSASKKKKISTNKKTKSTGVVTKRTADARVAAAKAKKVELKLRRR